MTLFIITLIRPFPKIFCAASGVAELAPPAAMPIVEINPRAPSLAATMQSSVVLYGPIPACIIGYLVPIIS